MVKPETVKKAARVKRLREKGWTYREIGLKVGVSLPTVWKLLNGYKEKNGKSASKSVGRKDSENGHFSSALKLEVKRLTESRNQLNERLLLLEKLL